ncbi:MAG TPA: hypothetical protein VMU48_09215 [Terracidiphilus sp.]|nr:hypothetical protein [Terracidiphilus sp.]
MSNPTVPPAQDPQTEPDENLSRGPNLVLIYIVLAVALLAAIAIAAFIVLPFYLRR